MNTDRRWRKGTCLLICITFRPKNILIIIYQCPNPTEDNIANPCKKNSRNLVCQKQKRRGRKKAHNSQGEMSEISKQLTCIDYVRNTHSMSPFHYDLKPNDIRDSYFRRNKSTSEVQYYSFQSCRFTLDIMCLCVCP